MAAAFVSSLVDIIKANAVALSATALLLPLLYGAELFLESDQARMAILFSVLALGVFVAFLAALREDDNGVTGANAYWPTDKYMFLLRSIKGVSNGLLFVAVAGAIATQGDPKLLDEDNDRFTSIMLASFVSLYVGIGLIIFRNVLPIYWADPDPVELTKKSVSEIAKIKTQANTEVETAKAAADASKSTEAEEIHTAALKRYADISVLYVQACECLRLAQSEDKDNDYKTQQELLAKGFCLQAKRRATDPWQRTPTQIKAEDVKESADAIAIILAKANSLAQEAQQLADMTKKRTSLDDLHLRLVNFVIAQNRSAKVAEQLFVAQELYRQAQRNGADIAGLKVAAENSLNKAKLAFNEEPLNDDKTIAKIQVIGLEVSATLDKINSILQTTQTMANVAKSTDDQNGVFAELRVIWKAAAEVSKNRKNIFESLESSLKPNADVNKCFTDANDNLINARKSLASLQLYDGTTETVV